jgi:hypothetical protein
MGRPNTARRRLVWLAALLVTLLIAGSVAFVFRYQPLASQNLDGAVSVRQYREGATSPIAAWLTNDGPLGITVTKVDRTRGDFLVGVVDARLPAEGEPSDLGSAQPFRSFSLGSGESKPILLVLKFANCRSYDPGTGSTLLSVGIHFRVLGIPHTTQLDLPEGITVEAPGPGQCPGRSS